jgi:PiT family inorganic phosphate transporter
MALGTYVGGWRIIKTMGTRIAKIDPPQGFAAQTTCAGILWTTAHYGFPVSTTQTISGCVTGAGASRRFSAVRWGIAGNIVVAWILTLPAAGLVGALMEVVTRLPAGNLIVVLLAGAIAAAAFLGRRYETRRLLPAPA